MADGGTNYFEKFIGNLWKRCCFTWAINDEIIPRAGDFHRCIFQLSKNCEFCESGNFS